MMRWLCLICAFCGALAAQSPTPRQSFETFLDAVLNRAALTPEQRSAAIEAAFDFEAWAADRETAEGRAIPPAERKELREQWLVLLASDEFARRWREQQARIVAAPEPRGDDATLEIALGAQGESRFEVRLKRPAGGGNWRWYAIVPLDAKPGENPVEAPRSTAGQLAELDAQLEALRQKEEELAALGAALRKKRGELLARLEEERGAGAELGTPRELAEVLARALNRGDWGAFMLCHAPDARRESARPRFDAQAAKARLWRVATVHVTEPGARATVVLEVRGADNRPRAILLSALRAGGRWWIDEEP